MTIYPEHDVTAQAINLEELMLEHGITDSVHFQCAHGCGYAAEGEVLESWPCLTWLLARRVQIVEEQLALIPKRGQDVLQGFTQGAHEGSAPFRPGPVTAPRTTEQQLADEEVDTRRHGINDIVDAEVVDDDD